MLKLHIEAMFKNHTLFVAVTTVTFLVVVTTTQTMQELQSFRAGHNRDIFLWFQWIERFTRDMQHQAENQSERDAEVVTEVLVCLPLCLKAKLLP